MPSPPAFTQAPPSWRAVATRDTPARPRRVPTRTSAASTVVHPRRVRVAHRSARPRTVATPARRVVHPVPQSLPKDPRPPPHRPAPSPPPRNRPPPGEGRARSRVGEGVKEDGGVAVDVKVGDVAGEVAVEHVEKAVVRKLQAEAACVDEAVDTPKKPKLDSATRRRRRKEKAQKEFLTEQLEKRQLANEAKKHRKPSKRVRAATPSSIRMRNSVALKDTFQAYMEEISREELLGQAEVVRLAAQIRCGVAVEEAQRAMESKLGRRPSIPELAERLGVDAGEVQKRRMAGTAAKNSLVAANLRLVTSVARKVASGKGASTAGIALDDMVQEGSVGLIRAAEKFDATRGYKFSTYATWWVRAYVMRSITTQSRSIKVPSTVVDEYARIRKEYNTLRESGVFKPTDEQVAHSLGITPAKLRFVVNVVTRVPTSLDISLNPSGDTSNSRSLGEIVEGDDNVEERMVEDLQRRELDTALRNCLRPLERAVVRLRFGLDDGQTRTLRETGELLGLSKERIRQIIFRALPKMKTPEIQRMLVDATTR